MITVTKVNGNPEYIPNTKFGSFFDGTNYYYFESDQERADFIAERQRSAALPPKWKELKQSLFTSPLFQRAITEANPNAYSTLLKIITDGENGDANEQNFLMVFNMLGMSFSVEEKLELNGYLEANNFTIRIQ